jgi:hypothetical protein
MEMNNEKADSTTVEPSVGILDEYNSLKSEIFRAQQQRIQIISLTVSVIGVILSISANIVLGSDTITPDRRLLVALGGAIALYVVLIPALGMMISTQNLVRRLGSYLRIFVEPKVPGLNWESHRHNFRLHYHHKIGLQAIGRFYYFLSILPLLLPLYALSQYVQGWPTLIILIPFIGWSFFLSYDLQTGKSPELERVQWEDYLKFGKANSSEVQDADPEPKS